MVKNLLVLRNRTSLQNTKDVFSYNINGYYQEISISEPLNINLNNINADIVLITSQNSLRAVKDNLNWFNFKKIYCLNKEISKKLKVLHVQHIKCNNTKDLAKYIIDNEKPNQKIVHLCADNANKLFYSNLRNAGFDIKEIEAYKTTFIKNLSTEILNALKAKQIKYIMLFSRASAIALKNIFLKNSLDINDYKFICFSKRIAEEIATMPKIYVKNSTIEEMLNLYLKQENSNG